MRALVEKVYCAFCRLERTVYTKKTVNWTNVVLSLGAAGLMSFVVWNELDPRAVVLFCTFIAIAEIFVRVRWRLSVRCPHCGFDPVLYKTDIDEAVRQVRERLNEVRATGGYLLKKNNPLMNLPAREVNSDDKPGQLLSKQL